MIAKYIDSRNIRTAKPAMYQADGVTYFGGTVPDEILVRREGWLPVVVEEALEPREGHAIEAWYTKGDDAIYERQEYAAVQPQPILISKAKVEAAVERMGKEAEFVDWLWSNPTYAGAWYRGGDSIAYDPGDNESDLASLIAALGIGPDAVPALIESVKEGE